MSKDKIEVSMNVYDIPIVVEALEKANKEIERLNKKIEQYESPEDMTLMFMWCDEKAKDEIKRLNNIINELERRFNQELENNEKWDIEDTKQFYSKKWYKDTLNDFKNMIKN